MRNFRLTIEYDGTAYNGWQIQSAAQRRKKGRVKTIQGTLRKALYRLFSKEITIISCSRTDSGVHARAHIANFKADTELNSRRIEKALNSLLPKDIVVKRVEEARRDFNSQYDSLSKAYRYVICNAEHVSPFMRRYTYHFRQPLDISLMEREVKALLGRHDFSAFRSLGSKSRQKINCTRTVKKLCIKKNGRLIQIDIEADGFLYNMVRNIAGTLIEVGRGKFPPGSMRRILRSKDRKTAGPTAPAMGLCLLKVKY